jgi:hypothetical protein
MPTLAVQASLLPQPAQDLEHFLGDPSDPSRPFSLRDHLPTMRPRRFLTMRAPCDPYWADVRLGANAESLTTSICSLLVIGLCCKTPVETTREP